MILLLLACAPATLVPIEATLTDMPTVARLTWPDQPGVIAYGTQPDSLEQLTPEVEGETLLLGMRPDTEYFYILVDTEGNSLSERGSITTGSLPMEVETPELTGEPGDDYVVTVLGGSTWAPVILDPQGHPVWAHVEDRGYRVYRAQLSHDHQSVLYAAVGMPHNIGEGRLVQVGLDGTVMRDLSVPYLDHDMVELPDGTVGAITYDEREHRGEDLYGNRIVEIDAEDNITEVWSTWDDIDPDTTGGAHDANTWTHANAIDYDADADDYTISLRNLATIFRVDRATSEIQWAFGTDAATVTPDDPFIDEHQFEVFDDHILVMDNGDQNRGYSRVMEYELDTGRTTWSYESSPSVYNFVLGDVHRLDSGDTFVDWSTAGRIEVVSPDGEPRWRMSLGLGSTFGYADPVPCLYSSPPPPEL